MKAFGLIELFLKWRAKNGETSQRWLAEADTIRGAGETRHALWPL